MDDDGGEQVEPGHAVLPALARAVANFALALDPECEAQPVVSPAPHPDMLDIVVGRRVMAQQGGSVRGQVEQRARSRCFVSACSTSPIFVHTGRRDPVRKGNRLSHTQAASFPLAYDPAPYRNRPVSANTQVAWPRVAKSGQIRRQEGAQTSATTIRRPRRASGPLLLF